VRIEKENPCTQRKNKRISKGGALPKEGEKKNKEGGRWSRGKREFGDLGGR